MTFADRVKAFYRGLEVPVGLPQYVEALFPFKNPDTWAVIEQFLDKYYSDNNTRILLMGINPGRFGAGVTGIGFTDPIRLENDCGIENNFEKKPELSSKFIYDVIDAYGGPSKFYAKFFISAVSPIGYIKAGKNYNYYDEPALQDAVKPFAIACLRKKIALGCTSSIAFSVGRGKNLHFLEKINREHAFFDRIDFVPHPRWVMQYRLKRKDEFIEEYLTKVQAQFIN